MSNLPFGPKCFRANQSLVRRSFPQINSFDLCCTSVRKVPSKKRCFWRSNERCSINSNETPHDRMTLKTDMTAHCETWKVLRMKCQLKKRGTACLPNIHSSNWYSSNNATSVNVCQWSVRIILKVDFMKGRKGNNSCSTSMVETHENDHAFIWTLDLDRLIDPSIRSKKNCSLHSPQPTVLSQRLKLGWRCGRSTCRATKTQQGLPLRHKRTHLTLLPFLPTLPYRYFRRLSAKAFLEGSG